MPLIHAFEFLVNNAAAKLPSVVVVVGNDSTLRSWTIYRLMKDADVTVMDGEILRWIDLNGELSTASLFSAGERQTVVVRAGDVVVKDFRAELEQYFSNPSDASRLVLEVESLPSNTRLYKAAEKDHLIVQCSPPQVTHGRETAPDTPKIRKFLVTHIAPQHQTKLSDGAANALIEMVGDNIGLLDSEIAKLAVHLEVGGTITEALVRDVVAGWIGKTMWDVNDAVAGGNAAEALRHIDRLISGGQATLALLPQLAWALRRLGMATAVVDEWEAMGRSAKPQDGLKASGFKGRPEDFTKAEKQMKQLGRDRARSLMPWLLETDLKLKSSHSAAPRDRWAVEELICRLAKR
ncbi:MAG TPA: DNA polymerase III subunit delta [Planctomycetaceae bacterium]|nr:DNA polymerase III subunit delta [Planctomycetaceae bacterium]